MSSIDQYATSGVCKILVGNKCDQSSKRQVSFNEGKSLARDCGVQFSHTVSEQLGGQLEAGFTITDIFGDTNGEGRLHDLNVETFYVTRAIK